MKQTFLINEGTVGYTLSKFSSGEVHITLLDIPSNNTIIRGSVTSSDNLMELLLLVDALQRDGTSVALIMPYMAYSRQDRVCSNGEALSIRVMANLINSCNFTSVTTYNNHSDVTTALIDRCINITNSELIGSNSHLVHTVDFILAPDAGAIKETFKVARKLNKPMIRADKTRNLKTGDITGTVVYTDKHELENAHVLIVDDICAGGRTFLEIAKSLKAIEPTITITLFVTHGFFDHGIHAMGTAGINKFITTDSVYNKSFVDVTVLQL